MMENLLYILKGICVSQYIGNISTWSHITQAGSHNERIISNVVSWLLQLAVMTSAGLENLKANLSDMKIS
jgi:hypothetical protein